MIIFRNIFIRNFLGMALVSIVLVFFVFAKLNKYTRHGIVAEIPDVRGLSVEKAEQLFKERNLKFLIIDSVFVKSAIPGSIAETTPSVGSNVKQGRTIYLKINSYLPTLLTVPEVKDTSQRQSKAMLQSLGFENVDIKIVPGIYRDLVLGLESNGEPVEAGQRVTANTPLTLLVSSGDEDDILLEGIDNAGEGNIGESWF